MKLEIQNLWSSDLAQTSNNLPDNLLEFDLSVQFSLSEIGKPGGELFNCRVCSVSELSKAEHGQFITSTLVLDKFDWQELKKRIEKLLLHTSSCTSGECVIKKLLPCVEYIDE